MVEHIKTPMGLKTHGKRTWEAVTNKYELRTDELDILEDICREIDLINVLEKELKDAPLMLKGSQGQDVVNPMVTELRQHRATKRSLWSALKLPDDNSGMEANQQRDAANSRWASAYGAS
jgi:hypothetical protein